MAFVDDPIDLNEIKEELLPYLKRVLNFLIFFLTNDLQKIFYY